MSKEVCLLRRRAPAKKSTPTSKHATAILSPLSRMRTRQASARTTSFRYADGSSKKTEIGIGELQYRHYKGSASRQHPYITLYITLYNLYRSPIPPPLSGTPSQPTNLALGLTPLLLKREGERGFSCCHGATGPPGLSGPILLGVGGGLSIRGRGGHRKSMRPFPEARSIGMGYTR